MTARRPAGFTLLELLVALAVFAIMAVAAYAGLDSVLATQAGVERTAARLARLQLAYGILERDVEQAVNRGVRDEFGDAQGAFIGNSRAGDALEFTRGGWSNPRQQPRASLQRVAYRLEDNRLLRRHWNVLDRGGRDEPEEAVLLEDVDEVQVRFFAPGQSDPTDAWPPPGADPAAAAPPQAVEFTVVLADWGEITWLLLLADGVAAP
ncbi:MAG: type II secretion system minor pseudopilin GspJ [Pseudomonadota bacterium]|nr:type II secretion system minor pseudopilin GspJ [Pseudomonadota bacterium]